LGRTEKSLKKPRTIDLDLLFFGRVHSDSPFLTVPHPRLHQRKFVLVPMNDIAPHFVHPTLHQDIRTLLHECEDSSSVIRWNPTGLRADATA
jgi:2-amino-4-hydroxy-6-hydroxymethyldihydropteridine diphosphokinase